MAVELLSNQFQVCQAANRQFCTIPTPFHPLAKPPTCSSALYTRNLASITSRCSLQIRKNFRCQHTISDSTKCMDSHYSLFHTSKHHYSNLPRKATMLIRVEKPIHILRILPACSVMLSHFHLPPTYQNLHLEVNISLDMANLNMVNISPLDFPIWQHLEDHKNETWLQNLSIIPLIAVNKIYQHIISVTQHITPFSTADETTGDTDSIWTLFLHTGIYVMAIGSFIPAGLGIFCCYFFWCLPARLVH